MRVYNNWGICCSMFFSAHSLIVPRFLLSDIFPVVKSPLKYFMDEMYNGSSLRNTTTLGSEKGRESVYDTIFRLPWRCELVICCFAFIVLLVIVNS